MWGQVRDLTVSGDVDEMEFEVYLQNEGPTSPMATVRTVDGVLLDYQSYSSDFIYSNSFNNYVIRVLQGYQTPGEVTIEFAITTQFPSESNTLLQNNSVLTKDKNGQ